MDKQETILVVLPLHSLRGLLFGQLGDCGSPAVSDVTSPLHGERYYVKPVTYSIGKMIAELDSVERFFHVELIEPAKHAEIWLAEDWRESITRREKLKAKLAVERAEFTATSSLFTEIYPSILAKFANQTGLARMLALNIVKNFRTNPYPDVLQSLGIKEIVEKYRSNESTQ